MASVDPLEKNIEFAKATTREAGRSGSVEKKEADFPLLSDPTKETAKAYGVLNERGIANRWTFYIDKTGKISVHREDGEARHVSRGHDHQDRRAEGADGAQGHEVRTVPSWCCAGRGAASARDSFDGPLRGPCLPPEPA